MTREKKLIRLIAKRLAEMFYKDRKMFYDSRMTEAWDVAEIRCQELLTEIETQYDKRKSRVAKS